jgi:predicted phage baseplate assembly protein
MAIPPPTLDRRDHDRILKQLRELAARHVPEWKGDQDTGRDAGIMLHYIFTRLLEITLERLNKASEMNFSAFLNATGVSLLPPVPARVPLTFTPTSGSAPVLVPQGTRAGTTPKPEQQPIDFETAADLTVIPAALVAVWTMDPGWDRSADHTALTPGSSGVGFTPFTGTKRLPHVLFLGDDQLLDFNRAKVTVTLPGPLSQELQTGLKTFIWQYASHGQTINLATPIVNQTSDGQVQTTFEGVNTIEQTILKGPSDALSLRQGLRSRWLHAALPLPLAEGPAPEKLNLKNVQLSVDGENLLPDFAFFNAIPLDVTMPFYPFGETPKVGDAFYLSCREALAKPNARLALAFEVTATPQAALKLTWEFWRAEGWTAFTDSTAPSEQPPGTVVDGTAFLSKDGNVVLVLGKTPMTLGKVNGKDGLWIRVRIASGDYGKPAAYVAVDPLHLEKGFTLAPDTGNLAPPHVTSLKLSYNAQGSPQALVTQNGFLLTDQTVANASGGFIPFVGVQKLTPRIYADTTPALYLGFDRAFPEQPVTLFFVVAPRAFSGGSATGAVTKAPASSFPPSFRWEYFNGAAWAELPVLDQTDHFSHSGTVDLLTPVDIAPFAKFDVKEIYWIRAMLVQSAEGQATNADEPFRADPITTPRLTAIFMNTIPAVQAVTVGNEIVGSGNGLPGQTFRLVQSPVLAGPQILALEPELPSAVERDELLQDEGPDAIQQRLNATTGETEVWIRWHQVPDFNGSDPHSRHYALDHGTGKVMFGDGTRGLVLPLGTNNIVASYRVGAGSAGNVAKGAVSQVKSAVPGITSVINPLGADGGADLETTQFVQQRGPQTLRHRQRAVTRTDFEWLAREAAGTRLARVVCLPNINRDFRREPGWVTLVIVPQGTDPKPVPSVELIQQVEESVRNRAFAGLGGTLGRVNVTGPGYVEVAVAADVVLNDLRQAPQVKQRVTDALDKFLHPLTGGPCADGWVLGRNAFASEVFSVVQAVPGVNYVKSLQLVPSQAQHRLEFGSPFVCPLDLPAGSFVVSSDGRKAALLAEPVPARVMAPSLTVKGFKAGDRIVRVSDAQSTGTFNPPLTITSIGVDRDSATQLIGIESGELELPAAGTLLATLDNRIRLAVSSIGSGSFSPSSLRFLTLEDFKAGDSVQILLPGETSATPNLPSLVVKEVTPAPDVYLDSIYLVCPGLHRITVSAPTVT